jgi:hypothetical protein
VSYDQRKKYTTGNDDQIFCIQNTPRNFLFAPLMP